MAENKGKVGVAFSGGGIRSAALCSGVLRRLLQKTVHIDFLSCVSGGGYCGVSYLEWKYHHDGQDNPQWHEQFFDNMRKRCGVICDWTSLLRGITDTVVLLCLLFFVAVLVPILNVASPSLFIAFIVDYFVGDILRQGFVCPDPETKSFAPETLEQNPGLNETVQNIVNQTRNNECVRYATDGLYFTYKLFLGLVLATVLSYILTVLLDPKGLLHNKVKFLFYAFLLSFAFTFTPWLIEEYILVIPKTTSIGLLLLAILVWVGIPFLRNKTFWVILVYIYGYIIKWRVYKTNVVGIAYHDRLFNIGLCLCAFLLWLSPYIYALQRVAVQTYNRWKLQRAFFYPPNIGRFGCSGISLRDCFPSFTCCDRSYERVNKSLKVSDLRDIKPEYICNLLVGNWIKDPTVEDCESFSMLTITPFKVERIDSHPHEHIFENRINPEDVKLSDMMATSAAAVSGSMGIHQHRTNAVRDIQVLLGINMGKSLVAEFTTKDHYNCYILIAWVLPLIIQCLIVTPVILLPIVILLDYEQVWTHAIVATILFIASFLLLIATKPTMKNAGISDKVVRWCTVHIQQVRFIREISRVINYGPVPPPVLTLSDGGHVENLGLLPLLKRKCERIVVVDGGYSETDATKTCSLIRALEFARKWLRCSFSGLDGRDIVEDMKNKFTNKPRGSQPRSYSFKVEYFEMFYGTENDVKVGEGHILILSPRHPFKGEHYGCPSTWEEYASDTGQMVDVQIWGPGPNLEACEADRLTFCCCECCHRPSCHTCSIFCCGVFPVHFTRNQFFTLEMFSKYHREGYRASTDAKIESFLNTNVTVLK